MIAPMITISSRPREEEKGVAQKNGTLGSFSNQNHECIAHGAGPEGLASISDAHEHTTDWRHSLPSVFFQA